MIIKNGVEKFSDNKPRFSTTWTTEPPWLCLGHMVSIFYIKNFFPNYIKGYFFPNVISKIVLTEVTAYADDPLQRA